MQSCCIRGCDSYKQTTAKNIGYFKFPLHDSFLLKNWLRRINRASWKPSELSQICSMHFKEEDFDRRSNRKHPVLLTGSVPTIFPMQRKTLNRKKLIGESNMAELRSCTVENEGFEPHRNKVSLLRRKRTVSAIGTEDKSEAETELRNVLAKPNAVNGVELVSSNNSSGQKPFLRITINKKLNTSTTSKPVPFETIFLPYHEEIEVANDIIKVDDEACVSQNNASHSQNGKACGKSNGSNIAEYQSKLNTKEYTDKLKLRDGSGRVPVQKTASQDHMYSFPRTVKIQSPSLKARQESDQLRRRLEELRERRKREQLKMVRLQMHLIELEKKMKENNEEEIVVPNLGEGGKKPAGTKSSWLIREKEEYEKLLKDVREIKLRVLRERHNRELENIRRLQIQMTNLRKKMRENDKKEIALANLRESNNSGVLRPDWMKREEEEYEKLLQDVRKIKQSYKLRETKKQDSVKSVNSTKVIKSEKVLSNEDCALIETMQKKSKLMGEIGSGNRLMNVIETGIELINDNDEYGEVIGVIDDDSIDIDVSEEATMLTFNEELPDPGLLDS